MVLHKTTRDSLPRSTATSLAAWLGENAQVHIGFADRAKALLPWGKEAILFASNGKLIQLKSARLSASDRPRSMARFEREASEEVKACLKRAEFMGKWFAASGEYTTVMALWGIAP